jgi:hypothetical protein
MLRDGKQASYVSDNLKEAQMGLSGKKLPYEQDE